MAFESINPATGEVLKQYEEISETELTAAVEQAHAAFPAWRALGFAGRAAILEKFATALDARKEELGKLITTEMGKRLEEAVSEIEYCVRIVRFYTEGAEEFLADEPFPVEDAEAYVRHEPIGVLLGVMPWNFPFYQVVRFIAPNLMAGNVCLLKHAGCVPQCAETIERTLRECGLPQGVFTNLFASAELVEKAIARKEIAGVSLTGSEAAGAAVAAAAGKNLKRSVLELGGNDAFIVLEDADLDEVVKMAVKGRMVNNGQSCVASKRFIVVSAVADAFLAGMKDAFAALKLGDPMDPKTDLGPLSTEKAVRDLAESVKETIAAGATVVIGGKRAEREGAFYEATILTDVTPGMPTFDRELFGPVATVYVVESEEEAIALANDSSYGLGGSVFTADRERGRRVCEKVETGMMFVNQPTKSREDLPFGGIKNSGYGRELSRLGIMEFLNKKLIHLPKV